MSEITSLIDDLDSIIQLSKDSDTLGFDLSAGQTWIYPTNYQVRDYQYNITQAALHNNTLVSLPTGLGKTFIAAVVMYNFYRWYPLGKIIFMAPTRPLVKQQQDACYNITAIPPDATTEMTGSKIKANRVKLWKEKRVFFITPQILQNDIDVVLDLAQEIKCIVIDEAHKALGKNANCEAIKKINKINQHFRVLALSATPGSNFNSIRDVINNLLISHIESRTNESIDVAPYVFNRKFETFVIPVTGKLLAIKNKYIMILDKYTRPLLQFNIFSGNCANLTKGRIVLTMKEFNKNGRGHPKYNYILKTLNLCVTLYHGYDLLIRNGLRAFLVFYDGTISKPLLNCIQELHEILNDVRNYLGPFEETEMLPDGTIPEVKGPVMYSHPKFQKLSEVLIEHFNAVKDGDTRVMVFCEFRESVMEIYQMLLTHRPLIKPRVFVGQGGITQAKQLQAIKQFKSGTCNTLICTCIGEEGLDVGEVDLIVCFDIISKSPVRMVQRMGRTGRKRDGRVVILVTEGKEQQSLTECMVQKNNMNSLLESNTLKEHLYTNNPKMIPDNVKPQCNKMYITVKEQVILNKKDNSKKKTKATKNSNPLKNMFDNISSQSCSKSSEEDKTVKANKNKKSPIKGSRTSKKLQSSKTQMDLRSMFTKINSTQNTFNSSQVCTTETSDCPEFNNLITKIRRYLNTNTINKSRCKICEILNNRTVCATKNTGVCAKWKKPNLSILDSITSESLTNFCESIAPNKFTTFNKSKRSSVGTSNTNTTLNFFNLESISEIFSDDSTESQEQEYYAQDPVIFNHSIGIFESSKIYHTPVKENIYLTEKLNKTKNIKQKVCENENIPTETEEIKDLFEDEDDLIVLSDSEISPVICTQRFVDYKQKIQRKLFSQSQQNTDMHLHSKDKNQQTTCELDTVTTKCNRTEKQDLELNAALLEKENLGAIITPPKYESDNKSHLISNYENISTKSTTPSKHLAVEIVNLIKSTNMSTPKDSNVSEKESNIDFWDESIFEACDSDESLFEDENKEYTNKNTSQKCAEKQTEITDKDLKKSTESKEDSDSDATIVLSFSTDHIFEDIEQENLKFQPTKPLISTETNKSMCNKTKNTSLLSVTQAIELLDDSKFKSLDSPAKLNESKNLETSNQSLLNQILNNNLIKTSVMDENNKQINNSICNFDTSSNNNKTNINIDFSTNNTGDNKENVNENNEVFDDLEISEIFKDFDDESEEEFSLLSFSQNRKRKLQRNHKNSEGTSAAKSARTSIETDNPKPDNTQSKIFSNNNVEKILKITSDNTKLEYEETNNKCFVSNAEKKSNDTILENKKTVNSNLKDKNVDSEEHNLLTFSQNMKKIRSKKFKLSTLKTNKKPDQTVTQTITKTITQISPVQQLTKKVPTTNIPVIQLSDSDDDFEVRPTMKPVTKIITPVKKSERVNSVPSYKKSNDNAKIIANVPKSRSHSYPTKTKKLSLKKRSAACVFIDDQADVEDDVHYVSDSESDNDSDEQLLDSSFVSHTQNVLDQTDMRAKYLQSIRSPKFKPGAFKMPHRPPPQVYDNVFSQIEYDENDTYMENSFCVGNDQTLTQREGMSYLEMIEAQLENDNGKKNKKRKRIITVSDSD